MVSNLVGGYAGSTFVGEVTVGQDEGATAVYVSYDTGSDWLQIYNTSCLNGTCQSVGFDPAASGTLISPRVVERSFGLIKQEGHVYEDRVCVSHLGTVCLNNCSYFFVEQFTLGNNDTTPIYPANGVLGMTRGQPDPNLLPVPEVGPLIVPMLKEAGLADFSTFAFYLDNSAGGKVSWVDFNGFVKHNIKNEAESKIIWTKMQDSFYWETTCQGVSFGEPSSDNSFSFKKGSKIIAIFDTGTSFTMIPDFYWIQYLNILIHKIGLEDSKISQGYLTFPCTE